MTLNPECLRLSAPHNSSWEAWTVGLRHGPRHPSGVRAPSPALPGQSGLELRHAEPWVCPEHPLSRDERAPSVPQRQGAFCGPTDWPVPY